MWLVGFLGISEHRGLTGGTAATAAAAAAGADKWVFPEPILDEPAYRRKVRQLEGSA
jgi:hypothetical protein